MGSAGVLIAFDADDAGDRGATQLAESLAESGVETFRVQLPRGTDVNQIAVEAFGHPGGMVELEQIAKAGWSKADVATHCIKAEVFREYRGLTTRPSDHVPVIVEFGL